MKKIWFFLLLSAILVLVPIASAGTDEMTQAFPENDTAGYVPVDVISIDPAIKAATPYDMILIADAEGKQNLLDSIDGMNYDTDNRNISGEARKQMKTGLIEIWEKYPVVFIRSPGSAGYPTYGGSVIRIQFASNRTGIKLTDSENTLLKRIQVLDNYNYLRNRNLANTNTPVYPDRIPATRPAPLPAALAIIAIGCTAMTKAIRKQRGR